MIYVNSVDHVYSGMPNVYFFYICTESPIRIELYFPYKSRL